MALGLRSRLAVSRLRNRPMQVAAALPATPIPRYDRPVAVAPTTARLKPLRWFAVLVGVVACAYIAHAAYIHAKARLAQVLIDDAWSEALATGRAVKPWPWADTYPVARISMPRLGEEALVLAGDSGRTLAFGPGHRIGTPLPGTDGNSVISAHRDTHFRFLARVRTGDRVLVQGRSGTVRAYRIVSTEVVDRGQVGLLADRHVAELTLITCYPFDAVEPNGPLRYVVKAVAESATTAL